MSERDRDKERYREREREKERERYVLGVTIATLICNLSFVDSFAFDI